MDKNSALKEYRKCKKDPVYFLSNYVHVVHPIRGLVKFDLYPFQKRIINEVQTHRFNILRKFRQAGCTTIAAAYSLWLITFQHHKSVVILSMGDAESTEVLARIKIMYDELPPWLQAPKVEDNKHTLKLSTQSFIKSRPSGPSSGRGLSGSLLIIDECAFIENISKIWEAAYPTISTGGSAFILSTVNGIGNLYHSLYQGAIDGTNKFNAIDINWEDHPEYKRAEGYEWMYKIMLEAGIDVDKWEETTRANIPYRTWLQEYECEFLGTGETYVEGSILKHIHEHTVEPEYKKYHGRMEVWEEPHPAHEYVLAADTSIGRERDYSAFHVINLYTGNQAAEFYSNKIPINEFARVIATEGTLYNLAYVIPERNTIGNNLIEYLFSEIQYENVWQDLTKPNMFGIQITGGVRDSVIALMEEFVRLNKIKVNGIRTAKELLTFIIDENGKVKADENCHDDLVMSLCFAAFAMKHLYETTPMGASQGILSEVSGVAPMPEIQRLQQYPMATAYGGVTKEDLQWILRK